MNSYENTPSYPQDNPQSHDVIGGEGIELFNWGDWWQVQERYCIITVANAHCAR